MDAVGIHEHDLRSTRWSRARTQHALSTLEPCTNTTCAQHALDVFSVLWTVDVTKQISRFLAKLTDVHSSLEVRFEEMSSHPLACPYVIHHLIIYTYIDITCSELACTHKLCVSDAYTSAQPAWCMNSSATMRSVGVFKWWIPPGMRQDPNVYIPSQTEGEPRYLGFTSKLF